MQDPSHTGHRQRLRERYLRAGLSALHDHEILELLLTHVISRQDTKPLAKELLRRFRSVNGVLNASPDMLKEVNGIGDQAATLLQLVRDINLHCLHERVRKRSFVAHRYDVEQYLRAHFSHRSDEYVAVLLLDSGNRIIASEVIGEGTVNQCAIYPRVVVEKALKGGAAALILVHNHPGGTTDPSEADWRITTRLHEVGRLLDVCLLDHILVCDRHVVSLRELPRWPK